MAATDTNMATTSGNASARSGGLPMASGAGGGIISQVRDITQQPSFKRAFPTIVAAVVAVAALVVYALMQQPERTTLYASLPEAEKARIVDALTNSGVEVTLDPATGDVMVPVADYHRSKISLAAQGLPSTVPDGYDALGDIPMGTSRSVEMMKLKQTQEVELARSITEISSIQSARVHLALPERSVFVRDQQPPTASVFVQLARGRALDETQIMAIVNLVSASIPSMSRDNVTVVDQNGRLLTKAVDDPSSILSDNQLQYRMRLESIYRSRIETLVTPIVGPGNVTAQVNVDIDFTRSETTQERVDPKGNALRSEQSTSDVSTNKAARGIPGATANTAPLEADLQVGAPDAGGSSSSEVENRSSSEVRNYEVSRTVQTVQAPSSRIMRVAVAVLVRDQQGVDPETGAEISIETPEDVLRDIEDLAKSAVGFDPARGDTIKVTSKPFVSQLEGIEVDWHSQPWVEDAIKQVIMIIMLAVVALGVVRPLLNRILVPAGGAVVAAGGVDSDDEGMDSIQVGEGESLEDIKAKLKPKKSNISMEMLDTANTYDDKVALIRMIVSDEAGRVSNVFKQMMKKDLDMLN